MGHYGQLLSQILIVKVSISYLWAEYQSGSVRKSLESRLPADKRGNAAIWQQAHPLLMSTPANNSTTEFRMTERDNLPLYGIAFIFSFFVNMLLLTGPIFMMQVYDRVLGSRSEETLLTLTLLVVFLYAMMGLLDCARGRILARAGAHFQTALDKRVFFAVLHQSSHVGARQGTRGLADLEAVQRLLSSPACLAAFDLPWTPLFLLGILIFHPWLGTLAIVGGGVLVAIALLNQVSTKTAQSRGLMIMRDADEMAAQMSAEGDTINTMGMREAAFARWRRLRNWGVGTHMTQSDRSGAFSAASKSTRLFLQSAILAMGALLVLREDLTAGTMIAASILLGRALAPIEQTISNWALIQRAFEARKNLKDMLTKGPVDRVHTQLPRPRAVLDVRDLTVVPPGQGQAAIRMCSFHMEPGQALGVIGQSGSGKSTLARALTGLWPPATGSIRLDGATLVQYDPDTLGRYVGYLPQHIRLFDGSIKENIARLNSGAKDADVIRAAQKADAHDMILRLPDGYDTIISMANARLSGGQIQRIGLARALFGDPVLLVLDEPNSNLDNAGSVALNHAICAMKEAGCSVLIMAHRPAAIQHCDLLMVLESGVLKAFGPRDEVLKATVLNHKDIRRTAVMGGVA
ncbi:MAG: PrtD family type I secretion system ABC transporter [Polaromonas sp.]|jgi:PrtD family type I secretion system ABC transporter